VAEDAEEYPRLLGRVLARRCGADSLAPQAELEEAFPQLLPKRGGADADALLLELLAHRLAEGEPLGTRELPPWWDPDPWRRTSAEAQRTSEVRWASLCFGEASESF